MRRAIRAWSFCGAALLAAACGGQVGDAEADSKVEDATPPETRVEEDADLDRELDGSLGDAGGEVRDATSGDATSGDATSDAAATFQIKGTVTYDRPALQLALNGASLNYASPLTRPVRFATVQAIPAGAATGATPLATANTDEEGQFTLTVPGRAVTLQVVPQSVNSGSLTPTLCPGATWNVRVADNTRAGATYVFPDVRTFASAQTNLQIHAGFTRANGAYVTRDSAPFALLDDVVDALAFVCKVNPGATFPPLTVNWSEQNVGVNGNIAAGQIGSTQYRSYTGSSELFVVGKDNIDSDEYDAPVILHELGHYVEDRFSRTDTPGGPHGLSHLLDPRLAFAEGWGNAFSSMVRDSAEYADTYGTDNATSFRMTLSAEPTGQQRSLASESAVGHFLYTLFKARGGADRIESVLRTQQRVTPAFTNALSFAAYYHASYGRTSEGLGVLWASSFELPLDALCVGPCPQTGAVADPFDRDDDVGLAYAAGGSAARAYPSGGSTYPRDFWRLYRPLQLGANAATAHDQIRTGGYTYPYNKIGTNRWYTFEPQTTGQYTVTVNNLVGSNCNVDALDMYVFSSGSVLGSDESLSGCPQVTFAGQAGRTYTILARGVDVDVTSYGITVSQKPQAPLDVVWSAAPLVQRQDGASLVSLSVDVKNAAEVQGLTIKLRTVDGVRLERVTLPGGPPTAVAAAAHGAHAAALVRVPDTDSGYVVADVTGVVDGVPVARTVPYPVTGPRPVTRRGKLLVLGDPVPAPKTPRDR